MFIWSARASRIWPVLGLCLLAAIVVAALVLSGNQPQVQQSLPVASEVETPLPVLSDTTADGKSERLRFLKQFGWVVDTEDEVRRTVTLPTEFDALYEAFNSLQRTQGLDLTAYAGTQVEAYTYRILNYPDPSLTVFAELLVRQNKVIGGEIYATGEESFEHGFYYERPAARSK